MLAPYPFYPSLIKDEEEERQELKITKGLTKSN